MARKIGRLSLSCGFDLTSPSELSARPRAESAPVRVVSTVLRRAAGDGELAEVEAERACPAEEARRLGLGNGADEGGTLWYGYGPIRVEDGSGDGGLDGLADLGGLGAEGLVEVGLDGPATRVVVDRCSDRAAAPPRSGACGWAGVRRLRAGAGAATEGRWLRRTRSSRR